MNRVVRIKNLGNGYIGVQITLNSRISVIRIEKNGRLKALVRNWSEAQAWVEGCSLDEVFPEFAEALKQLKA